MIHAELQLDVDWDEKLGEDHFNDFATGEARHGRTAMLFFLGDKLIFDNSEGEYGAMSIDITVVAEALIEHLNILKEGK